MKCSHYGFSLVELLIGAGLGTIVLGGAIAIYALTIKSSADILKANRLNHDLDAVMQLMVTDIKRAGYWGGARVDTDLDAQPNPFMQAETGAATDLLIPATGCILYSYDIDNGDTSDGPDVPDGQVNSNEYYGFKLVGDEIKIRFTGTKTDDCDDGAWESLTTSTEVRIAGLQFSFSPVVGNALLNDDSRCFNLNTDTSYLFEDLSSCEDDASSGDLLVFNRIVNIYLRGCVANDASLCAERSEVVQVANNKLLWVP